jgi:phosphoesterase RecJ-like protein
MKTSSKKSHLKANLTEILDALRRTDSVLITTHVNPDGDAIGSVLALRDLYIALGASQVQCAADGDIPRIYHWLPGIDHILPPDQIAPGFDCAVIVDASHSERIERVAEALPSGCRTIVIDHHLDADTDADLAFVDPEYAATGEIVFELFELAAVPLSGNVAQCLYAALVTDTGGFRFSNTKPRSHRIAAALLEAGLDVATISARLFDAMSPARFHLLKRVMDNMQLAEGGRVVWTQVTQSDLEKTGAKEEDLSNFVNIGRNIDGAEVAILFLEIKPDATKISLRSGPSFNSLEVARAFGGGGHAPAGGATLPYPLEKAREMVLERVHTLLENAS